jgi:hypothetical protein
MNLSIKPYVCDWPLAPRHRQAAPTTIFFARLAEWYQSKHAFSESPAREITPTITLVSSSAAPRQGSWPWKPKLQTTREQVNPNNMTLMIGSLLMKQSMFALYLFSS